MTRKLDKYVKNGVEKRIMTNITKTQKQSKYKNS